jgi:hypothetical protein
MVRVPSLADLVTVKDLISQELQYPLKIQRKQLLLIPSHECQRKSENGFDTFGEYDVEYPVDQGKREPVKLYNQPQTLFSEQLEHLPMGEEGQEPGTGVHRALDTFPQKV